MNRLKSQVDEEWGCSCSPVNQGPTETLERLRVVMLVVVIVVGVRVGVCMRGVCGCVCGCVCVGVCVGGNRRGLG